MKIGINARTFSTSEPGGAVQTAIQITKEIIKQSGNEIILFGHKSIKSDFPNTQVKSDLFKKNSQIYGVFWERSILPKLAKRSNIDVLFCPNANGPLTQQPYPITMYIHDVNALKGFSAGVHQFYRSITVPRAAKVANSIITVSHFSKSEILSEINLNSEEINVIYNGVDNVFHSSESSRSNMFDSNYILYVGSINPRKNISGILRSYRILREQYDIKHKIVFVGPGNKSIFKNQEVDPINGVITPGFVEKEELAKLYRNADVFLYPSFYEGFGLPPLESLACGTPAVVSNTGALLEIAKKGTIQVDPNNPIEIAEATAELIQNKSKRFDLSNEGQEYISKFTWQRTGASVLAHLDQLINGG